MKTYSVGKSPWAWADTLDQAARIRRDAGMKRLPIYEWQAERQADGVLRVSHPRCVTREAMHLIVSREG